MLVETEENFSLMMDACNLHFNKICISPHSTIPHNVVDEEPSKLKPSDSVKPEYISQSYYHARRSFKVLETEALDGDAVLKTMKTMKAMQTSKDPVKKAIDAYSKKITVPYPRIVFGGLFEALEMVVNEHDQSKGDAFDTKAAQHDLADYSKDRIRRFRLANNTLKHPKGHTTDEDVSRGVVEFRPVVAKLLRKQLSSP